MLTVQFDGLNAVEDELLKYAVLVGRYQDRWVYCRHKNRNTWEIPGGRREPDEAILDTAKRELFEETGALDFDLFPVCIYSVTEKEKSYGLLCYAEIKRLGPLPDSEIELIQFFENEPAWLTYPQIQPLLFERVKQFITDRLPAKRPKP